MVVLVLASFLFGVVCLLLLVGAVLYFLSSVYGCIGVGVAVCYLFSVTSVCFCVVGVIVSFALLFGKCCLGVVVYFLLLSVYCCLCVGVAACSLLMSFMCYLLLA